MYVNDAGVFRRVRSLYVNDGGVLRRVRQIYLNDGGVLRKQGFAQRILNASMLQGSDLGFLGYQLGTFGTLTPDTTTNGYLVITVDYDSSGGNKSRILISSGSDPGQGALSHVIVNGTTSIVNGANWSSYAYGGGTATWEWTGNLWSLDGVSTVPVELHG